MSVAATPRSDDTLITSFDRVSNGTAEVSAMVDTFAIPVSNCSAASLHSNNFSFISDTACCTPAAANADAMVFAAVSTLSPVCSTCSPSFSVASLLALIFLPYPSIEVAHPSVEFLASSIYCSVLCRSEFILFRSALALFIEVDQFVKAVPVAT